ncbi:MAG: tail fiber domain-containing protein [Candidatus Moraniibacteriota bacterium]|nr:MAG: tail fiber domain-containing protein [Candidatus Moranbacteria bacterium]
MSISMHCFQNKERKYFFISLLSVVVLTGFLACGLAPRAVFAQEVSGGSASSSDTGSISVSAVLLQGDGEMVPNASYSVRFSLYRSDRTQVDPYPSDADRASRVWEETQIVEVKNGVLETFLGKSTPLPNNFTFEGGNYFLGIRVESDAEMVPRKKLGKFPNAVNSQFLRGRAIGNNAGDIVTYGVAGKLGIEQLPTGTKGKTLLLADNKDFTSSVKEVSALSKNVDTLSGDLSNLSDDFQSLLDRVAPISGNGHTQNTDTATNSTVFTIGSGIAINSNQFRLSISSASNAPALRYDGGIGEWQFSDDGTTFSSFTSAFAGMVNGSGSPGQVSYWINGTTLSGENYLSAVRGGTGIDTSSFTGVPFLSSGVWSVDSPALSVSHGGTGIDTSSFTGVPFLSSGVWSVDSPALSVSHGGTGIDTSSFTGVPFLSSGVWSVDSPALSVSHGGTGIDTSSFTGVPFLSSGVWSVDSPALSVSHGGTGIDTSSFTGVPFLSSGVWSVDSPALSVSHGGTGNASFPSGGILYGNAAGAIQSLGILGNGQLLIGIASGAPTLGTLTSLAGSVTIANGVGTINLESSLGVSIDSAEIENGSVLGIDLGASGAPLDGQILTFNSGTGGFSWVSSGGGGIGDITAIGDVSAGEAFTSTSTQGTSLYWYDPDGRGQLTRANLTASRTWTLPNESGTICTSGSLCAGYETPLQRAYDFDADGSNATLRLSSLDDSVVFENPASGGTDSGFLFGLNQLNATAPVSALDIVQASNAANAVNITANVIDTETALAMSVNGLTSGSGLSILSSSTGLSGSLATLSLSGSAAANTGSLLALKNTGVQNANTSLLIEHAATGTNNLAFRIDDVIGDTTPFVVNGAGAVGIGTASPVSPLELYGASANDEVLTITSATTTHDPLLQFRTSATTLGVKFSLGVDTSDADTFKIDAGNTLGSSADFAITSTGTTTIADARLGAQYFPEDGGILSWIDMAVTPAVPSNTVLSYSAQLDTNPVLTVYGVADGSGGVGSLGVGIGTTTPSSRLDVSDDRASGYAMRVGNDGNNANRYGMVVQAGADDGSGTTYYLNALDGDGTQIGYIANTAGTFAITDPSDIRTKTNIENTLTEGLGVINRLRVVDFNRVSHADGPRLTGFIAQEVQEVYPNVISTGENGYLGISKAEFIPVLVKAVQEEDRRVSDLASTLESVTLSTDGHATTLADLETSVEERFSLVAQSDAETKMRLATFEQHTADMSGVTKKLETLESAVSLLQSSNETLLDFYNTLSLGSVLVKDADGNLDLSKGVLRVKELRAESLVVTVSDDEAPSIGAATLFAKAIDVKGKTDESGNDIPDGKDDRTGDAMDDPEVAARDGKKVVVSTKAVSNGARIFVTPKKATSAPLAVTKVDEGKSFTVEVRTETSEEIPFDWVLVEER